MKITVKYFGPWKGILGRASQVFELGEKSDLTALLAAVKAAHGPLYDQGMEHGQVFLRCGPGGDYHTPRGNPELDETCTVLLSGPVEGG